MPIARSLFELQQIDSQMLRLQREKSRLADGSALRAERDTLENAIVVEDENLNEHNRARATAEEELKQREEKLRTQQTRLMNAKSAHEIASLERDIEGITKSRGEFDEAILVSMDEAEASAHRLDELRAQLAKAETELATIEERVKNETGRIDSELQEAARGRNAAAASIDEELLEKYDTVARRHAGVAVTENIDGNCSVCGMVLTPHNLKEAKTLEWPTCESCGRLLFAVG